MKQYGEAIKLDNLNELESDLDLKEKEKLKNFSSFDKKLNKLKKELKILKSGKKIEGTNIRKKMYEINELNAYRKFLNGLRNIVNNDFKGEKFISKNISKYDLVNYKLVDFTGKKSWGIAMSYKDISSLNIQKDKIGEELGYNIDGYIHYISVVNGEFVDKNLVVLDNKVYKISDNGQLNVDEDFEIIDGIKIKEIREGTTENIAKNLEFKKNHPDFENGKIIDSKIENKLEIEINKISGTSEKVEKILEKYLKSDFIEYHNFMDQIGVVSLDEIKIMFNDLSNDKLIVSNSTLDFISKEFTAKDIKELHKEVDQKIEKLKKIGGNKSELLIKKFKLFKTLTEISVINSTKENIKWLKKLEKK